MRQRGGHVFLILDLAVEGQDGAGRRGDVGRSVEREERWVAERARGASRLGRQGERSRARGCVRIDNEARVVDIQPVFQWYRGQDG